ncbi:MAG: VOC family protein [Alphaproteobacteria bacterium]|nr:VOC family protein [Alphaproteobacteria bacterium]
MKPGRGLDHLVLAVRDLDAAAARYQRWGFTLTPRAQHPWGTANRLVQFDGVFLELVEVDRPALIAEPAPGDVSFGARARDFLQRREGFAMLVFESRDARIDYAELLAAGLAARPPFDFSRPARLPDGSVVTVGFSLVFLPDPRIPDATIFLCQQQAPQHFWKPAYQRHANATQGVGEVVMSADRPAAWEAHFAALQGEDAVRNTPEGLDVATARGRVVVRRSADVAARFGGPITGGRGGTPGLAGFSLETSRLEAVTEALAATGTRHRRLDDRVVIPADEAFGCGLEFVQAAR